MVKGKVTGIQAAWLGLTPKGTKFIRLMCVVAGSESLYHTLWLTDKTKDNTFKSLIRYGFKGELEDIGNLDDPKDAHTFFITPSEGVEVEIKTEKYTPKGSTQSKEVTKIDCVVGFRPAGFQGVDKSKVGLFKQDSQAFRKARMEAGEQALPTAPPAPDDTWEVDKDEEIPF